MEDNLKAYLLSYLKYRQSIDTTNALNTIWNIAGQCIFYGGPSVMEARAFLFTTHPDMVMDTLEQLGYNWQDTCIGGGGGSKTSDMDNKPQSEKEHKLEVLNYKIIPNLFNGNRTGNLKLGIKEAGYAEIYSITGTMLNQYRLTAGNNQLDLNQLPKGVFIYKIYVNGAVKTNDKLVVIE